MKKRSQIGKSKRSKKAKMATVAVLLIFLLANFANVGQVQAKTKKTNEISFTFSSEKDPWSEKELKTLKSEIEDFYPLAKKVFGAPAVSVVVNIRKNSESGPFFWQSEGVYEIVLPGTANPNQLLHEMLHSFHGPYIMDNNAFEEGMVRAGEVEIMNRLPKYDYSNRNHRYLLDVYYEANNDPAISARDGKFYSGFVNPLLRYQQAGYAWGKCLIENKNFLAEFNRDYYKKAAQDKMIASDDKALKKIAGKMQRKVEGESFDKWFSSQAIFNFSPEEGYQMLLKRDSQNIYIFERDASGREKMLSNVSFSWKTYDYDEKLLGQGEGITNSNGWDWLNMNYKVEKPTRIRVEVEAVLPGGRTVKKEFISHTRLKEEGIFGIVSGREIGKVQVKKRKTSFEAPVINGTFAVSEAQDLSGRFEIIYDGEGGKITKTITKDASGYYVVLGE